MDYNNAMERKNSDRQVFLRRLPTLAYVLVGIVCLVMVPFSILSICKVAEVGTLFSVSPVLDIAAATLEIVLAVAMLLVTFLSRYVVTKDGLVYQRVFCTNIPAERLLLMRYELSTKMLVLYYADERAPEGVRFLVLQVFERKTEEIVAAIQHCNPAVSYDVFDRTKQEKDE